MKNLFLITMILGSSLAFADCTYVIKSNLSSSEQRKNGFHYEMESVLSNKGYKKVYRDDQAEFIVSIENKTDVKVKENFFTALKDAFDSDNETDYFMKYTSKVKVSVKNSMDENIPVGSERIIKGETVDNYIHLDEQLAQESVKEGAIILSDLPECRE